MTARAALAPFPPAMAGSRCGGCRYFDGDAAALEAAIPGFFVMGSAHSSVRAGDGLCRLRERYLSCGSGCGDFAPRLQAVPGSTPSSAA